jgi:23S rRNA pseudouridine1911/1915/1917 synthase
MTQTTEGGGSKSSIEKIYEDDNILVVYKPHGMLTHSSASSDEESVASWFVEEYPESENVGEPLVLDDGAKIQKPGIVHRLDKDTSGVLLLVKTEQAFQHIKEQFKARKVEKVYRAFVYGVFKEDAGVIDRPIGRSAKDFRLRSAQRGSRGKVREAITHYTVLGRGKNNSYLELRPKTGRMHQLRVHLKAVNHPIVCDSLYAPKQKHALGFSRLALHASRLEVEVQPGKVMSFEAPLPQDFIEAEKAL